MEFKFNSDLTKVQQVSQKILRCLNGKKLHNSFRSDIRLACEEAMINAIKYGNGSDLSKQVSVSCNLTPQAIVIAVADQGQGFDYQKLPDPTQKENLAKSCGRGLFLIRKMMDRVEFNSTGNKITMTKFFTKSK